MSHLDPILCTQIEKQPKCPWQDKYIFLNVIYFLLIHKKEKNPATFNNIDGAGGHYAK